MKIKSRSTKSKFRFSKKKPPKGKKNNYGNKNKSGSFGGVKSPSMFVEHRNR